MTVIVAASSISSKKCEAERRIRSGRGTHHRAQEAYGRKKRGYSREHSISSKDLTVLYLKVLYLKVLYLTASYLMHSDAAPPGVV
ncbi:MAG: hypothetical protein AAFV29_15840 [Myxococcota bacterium]